MSLTFSVIPAALPKTPGPQQEPSVPTLWPSYQGHCWWVEASQQKHSWVSLWWHFFDLDKVVFNIVTRVLVVSYDSNVNDKTIIKASVTNDTLICLFFYFLYARRFFINLFFWHYNNTFIQEEENRETETDILWLVFNGLALWDQVSVSTDDSEVKPMGLCAAWWFYAR